MSDILLYNHDAVWAGKDMASEVEEGRALYDSRVLPDLRPVYDQAVEMLLRPAQAKAAAHRANKGAERPDAPARSEPRGGDGDVASRASADASSAPREGRFASFYRSDGDAESSGTPPDARAEKAARSAAPAPPPAPPAPKAAEVPTAAVAPPSSGISLHAVLAVIGVALTLLGLLRFAKC